MASLGTHATFVYNELKSFELETESKWNDATSVKTHDSILKDEEDGCLSAMVTKGFESSLAHLPLPSENLSYLTKKTINVLKCADSSTENEVIDTLIKKKLGQMVPLQMNYFASEPTNLFPEQINFETEELLMSKLQELLPNDTLSVIQLQKKEFLIVKNSPCFMVLVGGMTEYYAFGCDSLANIFLVNTKNIKLQDDPADEPWFYPVIVDSAQMTAILKQTSTKGCFYVYKSTSSTREQPYNLSVCISSNAQTKVKHHHINCQNRIYFIGKFTEECFRFLNLHTLVQFFKQNRGFMECRLRLSPKELQRSPTFQTTSDCIRLQDFSWSEAAPLHSLNRDNSLITTFKAEWHNASILVKAINKAIANRIDLEDFKNHGDLLATLSHDRIVKLISAVNSESEDLLFLEFAPCGDLRQHLTSQSAVKLDVFEVVQQIASGLQYIHEKLIIHRDIAARNVVISQLEPVQVKLSDFSRAVQLVEYDEYIAEAGEKLAFRWSAPESIEEIKYSTKTDIWSLGVLIWEIVSNGDIPYSQLKTNQEVQMKVLNNEAYKALTETKLPKSETKQKENWATILQQCLKKDPVERLKAEQMIYFCRKMSGNLSELSSVYESTSDAANLQFIRKTKKGWSLLKKSLA